MNAFIKLVSIINFLFTVSISAQKTTWLDGQLKETNQAKSVYYTIHFEYGCFNHSESRSMRMFAAGVYVLTH